MTNTIHGGVRVSSRAEPEPAVLIKLLLPGDNAITIPFPPDEARALAEQIFGVADGLDAAAQALEP